jgi:hypothetical protein
MVTIKTNVFSLLAALETPAGEMFETPEIYSVNTVSCRKKKIVKTYQCGKHVFFAAFSMVRSSHDLHVLQLSSFGKDLLTVPRGLPSYVASL